MTDQEKREKVLKGLEKLRRVSECDHRKVDGYATADLCNDTLELLKAQEPVETRVGRDGWYRCGGCNIPIASGERVKHFYGHQWPKYCERCGRAVKWV